MGKKKSRKKNKDKLEKTLWLVAIIIFGLKGIGHALLGEDIISLLCMIIILLIGFLGGKNGRR